MKNKFVLVALATPLFSLSAHAADLGPTVPPPVVAVNDILIANNQLAVDFLGTSFGYTEYALFAVPGTPAGGKLDTEGHWIPGVNASFSIMQNFIVNNLYLNAQMSYSGGTTHYVGQTLAGGGFGSLTAIDSGRVFDTDFRIGEGFQVQQSIMLTPYLGFGSHHWSRGPLPEDYSDGYVGPGLMAEFSPMSKLVLSAYGLVGGTFGSNISVHSGVNSWSGPLGNSTIFKVGAGVDYALTTNIHVNAGIDYVNYAYGHSSPHVLPGGTFSEPHSTTSNLMAKVGLGYSFY